jgi:hypothetical protein
MIGPVFDEIAVAAGINPAKARSVPMFILLLLMILWFVGRLLDG